jgi:EmrB/QacA subfamily drug resistance transporter
MAEALAVPQQRHNPRLVLSLVCFGLFLTGLSHRGVLVSLPTVAEVFHTDLSYIQWVLLVYDLAVIGLVLTFGRLGDLFGRRRIYVAGFILFSLGSALSGLSQSLAQLIGFRILQGIGGAMIVANGRAIASLVVPASERGRALGLTSTAFHIGYMTGPTLGGLIIDTIGWRWLFHINAPLGLVSAYFAWKVLKDRPQSGQTVRVDLPGAALLFLANTVFVYTMNQMPHLGFRHPLVGSLLVVSAITLFLFIRTELRAQDPILSLSLFRSRLFTAANLSLFFITCTQSAISVLLPFYLQNLIGFSAAQMGWILIANSIVIIIVAPVAGWLSDRFGSRLLCSVGSALIVLGQFLIGNLTLQSSVLQMVLPQVLTGLGWAIFNSPNQSAILGAVPRDKVGAASGMTVTTARVGGAFGIALSGAILTYGLGAGGLTAQEIESPQTWNTHPEIFMRSFSQTVHIINLLAVLSIFFSALRGGQKS